MNYISLCLNGYFLGKPGLASFIAAEYNGNDRDNLSYNTCKTAIESSPPTKQHPTFYRLDAIPVTQPTVSKQ